MSTSVSTSTTNPLSDREVCKMMQRVKVGDRIVELNSGQEYLFTDKPDEEERYFRKALSLPVRKSIVYYKDKHDVSTATKVVSVKLLEMYDITYRWYTCEILLYDGSKVRIHSLYLAEMQKPDFVSTVDTPDE